VPKFDVLWVCYEYVQSASTYIFDILGFSVTEQRENGI